MGLTHVIRQVHKIIAGSIADRDARVRKGEEGVIDYR